ncbi:MAG: hypothetical protein RIM99_17040 [Cyclobacteriaceae bacterium]
MKKLTIATGLFLTLTYSLSAQINLEFGPGYNTSKHSLSTDYFLKPTLLPGQRVDTDLYPVWNKSGMSDPKKMVAIRSNVTSQAKKGTLQFQPHSTNAFHIKAAGSINIVGSGFSIEPQYVTERNIAFGLQFSKWSSVQIFNNNTNMREDNQIKSILASVEKRYSESSTSGYIGFRMGIFTTDPGNPISPNTSKGERYSRLGINLNGGAYLWILYVEAGLGLYGDFEANLSFKIGVRI